MIIFKNTTALAELLRSIGLKKDPTHLTNPKEEGADL
jgi:hypothetical protein